MPRRSRELSKSGIYHVMLRGNQRKIDFLELQQESIEMEKTVEELLSDKSVSLEDVKSENESIKNRPKPMKNTK